MVSHERVTQMDTRELIRQLVVNVSDLIDKQMELAKVEVRENIAETVRGAATLLAGAVLGMLAIVALLVAGILALATIAPGWVAALIAFAILAVIAAIIALIGKGAVQHIGKRPLSRTRQVLREDVEWAKHRLTSNER